MALPQGINFRSTSGYVTDISPATFETTDTNASGTPEYPRTTAQGNTVGYETGSVASNTRNRNSGNDARLAGAHTSITSTAQRYRIDLPSAGTYNIRSASGDANYATNAYLEVFDTASSLGVLVNNVSTGAANSFYDASGVLRTAAAWPANNVAVSKTFSTTICRFKLSTGSASAIAHLYIESAGGSPDVTVALTGQAATSATGTLSPSTAKALTGQAATSAQGSVSVSSADVTVALSGQSATASAGTLAPSAAVALSGLAATGSTGTLVASPSVGLSGQSSTSATGTLSPAVSVALLGSAATGQQGNVGVVGDVTVVLTGQSMTMAQGLLVADAANPSTKIGGDDYPEERIEVWEAPRKPKKHDEKLDSVMRQAMDKAMGRQPAKPQPVIAKAEPIIEAPALVDYDEEDDEETLLLLL